MTAEPERSGEEQLAAGQSDEDPCEARHQNDANHVQDIARNNAPVTYDIGHRSPPKSTRFPKGVSGNPSGRPKKTSNAARAYDAVLGRIVTIRKDGIEQQVSAEEAFLLHIGKAGIDGDGAAARATLSILERAQTQKAEIEPVSISVINLVVVEPGSVTTAVVALRMGRRIDAFNDKARIMLEPWIVEAALTRLGSRQLSTEEQRVVFAATRTPRKVNWPSWWAVTA